MQPQFQLHSHPLIILSVNNKNNLWHLILGEGNMSSGHNDSPIMMVPNIDPPPPRETSLSSHHLWCSDLSLQTMLPTSWCTSDRSPQALLGHHILLKWNVSRCNHPPGKWHSSPRPASHHRAWNRWAMGRVGSSPHSKSRNSWLPMSIPSWIVQLQLPGATTEHDWQEHPTAALCGAMPLLARTDLGVGWRLLWRGHAMTEWKC